MSGIRKAPPPGLWEDPQYNKKITEVQAAVEDWFKEYQQWRSSPVGIKTVSMVGIKLAVDTFKSGFEAGASIGQHFGCIGACSCKK